MNMTFFVTWILWSNQTGWLNSAHASFACDGSLSFSIPICFHTMRVIASLHGCQVSPSMAFITSGCVKLGHCLSFFLCLLHATFPVPQYVETISSKQNELDNYISESYKNALSEERRRYCFLVDRQCAVAKTNNTYHTKVRIHVMLKKIWVAETLNFS